MMTRFSHETEKNIKQAQAAQENEIFFVRGRWGYKAEAEGQRTLAAGKISFFPMAEAS